MFRKKLPKSVTEFINKLKKCREDRMKLSPKDRDIFPIETSAQDAIHILCQGLLGEDWYIVDPMGSSQANTIIVDEILYKYNKEYRKEAKRYRKMNRKY